MIDPAAIPRILERARWAPSGDNTQPWRFEVVAADHLVVHGFDTRDHVVYDLDGHASQLAVGALLETIVIAASAEGLACHITRRPDTPDTHLLIDATFTPAPSVAADPLAPFIERRVVQRRPMSPRPLSAQQKDSLAAALPAGYAVVWFAGWAQRYRMARLMFANAKIRLNIREAFEVHRSVIEWGARYSEDRIPSRAVGVDPLTEKLMHWALQRWERIDFLNKWLLGDLAPRLQLDLLPGIFCAAHFGLLAQSPLRSVDDYLAAGRVLQRFWLTATRLDLLIQPEMTPLIFSRYHRHGRAFTAHRKYLEHAGTLSRRLTAQFPPGQVDNLLFIGRIGAGAQPDARSTRKSLQQLARGDG